MKDITADVANTLTTIDQLMVEGQYIAAHELMIRVIKNLSPVEMVQESEYMIFKRSDIKNLISAIDYLNKNVEGLEP